MKIINPKDFGENVFKMFDDSWCLVAAYDENHSGRPYNAMTASWGALGVLWGKDVCICFVRPERHTFKLLENEKKLSIAFLDGKREAYAVCGKESGANTDKLAKCGLSTTLLDGIPVIAESGVALTCKVLYEDDLKEQSFLDSSLLANYATAGYHRMYVCEVVEVRE